VPEIPETPDEQRIREDYEKRGAKDRDFMQALALGKIAGVDIPDSLTRVLSGTPLHIPGSLLCQVGHENPVGQKFCGECGGSMTALADEPQPESTEPAADDDGPPFGAPSSAYAFDSHKVTDVPLPEPPPADEPLDLASMTWTQLKAHAAELGMATSGNREVLLKRLSKRAEIERRSAAA
jgi:hypothetical protein